MQQNSYVKNYVHDVIQGDIDLEDGIILTSLTFGCLMSSIISSQNNHQKNISSKKRGRMNHLISAAIMANATTTTAIRIHEHGGEITVDALRLITFVIVNVLINGCI
jgi:hypothetical protein